MNMTHRSLLFILCCVTQLVHADLPPLGLFVPYDINLVQRKPAGGRFQVAVLGENTYSSRGYATDSREEITYVTNVLQTYEPVQNVVSMYQGFSATDNIATTLTTPFTQLLDSIAGGAGGGVSTIGNGLMRPTGKQSCGGLAFGLTYGCGQHFYVSAYLPFYFAKLSCVNWEYLGNSNLFSGQQIQNELVDAFAQDALEYFDLNIGNWTRKGLGDLAVIAEWQRDFPQRRPTLKNVQINARLGVTFPTALANCQTVIMPINFGADGAVSIPFGGGLTLYLGRFFDFGFSGQFWYTWSNEKLRRIKTFPTQTTLLQPVLTRTCKQFSIVQNFNITGAFHSFCNRFTLKGLYQYWRKGQDTLIPLSPNFNFEVVNSAYNLDEQTRHQISVFATYSPHSTDFQKCFPQGEIFWKVGVNGMRSVIASTYGAQISLAF